MSSNISSNRKATLELNIQHTGANKDLVGALRLHPLLANNIPSADVLLPQVESHRLGRASGQEDLIETTERTSPRAGNLEVQLRDFGAGEIADVADADGDGADCVEQAGGVQGVHVDDEVGVREFGVGQAVAELVSRGDVAGQEGSI
jgi:hypothetical protein